MLKTNVASTSEDPSDGRPCGGSPEVRSAVAKIAASGSRDATPSPNRRRGFDPGANRVGDLEECTPGRAGRPGFDDRVDRVARHPRSSCDLFDGEDVRENGHRRSADKGKSLASSACGRFGPDPRQCRFRPSPPAVSPEPPRHARATAWVLLQSLDEPVALAVTEGSNRESPAPPGRPTVPPADRSWRSRFAPPRRPRRPVGAPLERNQTPPTRRTRRDIGHDSSLERRRQRRQQSSRACTIDHVERVVCQWSICGAAARRQHVAESTGVRDALRADAAAASMAHDRGCLARHTGLGRDCGGDRGVVESRFAARVRPGARRSS